MLRKKHIFLIAASAVVFICFKRGGTPYKFPPLSWFPSMPVSEKNPVTVEGSSLGRLLFYDPVLSSDSSVSCSGCHVQKHAFSDAGKDFSFGVNKGKTVRNALPLFNLAWYPSFFYDGRALSLEDQISHPIVAPNEMNMSWAAVLFKLNASSFYKKKFKAYYGTSEIDSSQVKYVIAQFLRTLISHESKFDKFLSAKSKLTAEEFRGFRLMNNQTRGDCLHCHPTDGNALLTTMAFSNNGLDSVYDAEKYNDKGRGAISGKLNDNGKFRVPSLRNIAVTAPYMHDGRFSTLEEVLDFYSSGVHMCANVDSKMTKAYQKGVHLSDTEKKDIIAFLKTLTDSVFISKEEFGNPFVKNNRL